MGYASTKVGILHTIFLVFGLAIVEHNTHGDLVYHGDVVKSSTRCGVKTDPFYASELLAQGLEKMSVAIPSSAAERTYVRQDGLAHRQARGG